MGCSALAAKVEIMFINPLSAMVAIWHRIIVRFKVLAHKRFIGSGIFWMKCVTGRLAGAKSVYLWANVVWV